MPRPGDIVVHSRSLRVGRLKYSNPLEPHWALVVFSIHDQPFGRLHFHPGLPTSFTGLVPLRELQRFLTVSDAVDYIYVQRATQKLRARILRRPGQLILLRAKIGTLLRKKLLTHA